MENLKISSSTRTLEGPCAVPPPPRPPRPDAPQNSLSNSSTPDRKQPRHKELSKQESRDQKRDHQGTSHPSHSHNRAAKPIDPITKGIAKTSQLDDCAETHEEADDADLPPPEVSPASILAILSLGNHITNLKHLIGMYEDFEKICRDTPAHPHFARQFVASFYHVLRALSRTCSEARYLLDEGQGTVEPSAVEIVAAKVLAIAREARKELKRRLGQVQSGEEEGERLDKGMRGWVMEFYVGKMGAVLRQLEGERVVREVKGMQEALVGAWEAKKGMSGKEVEEMVKRDGG